MGQLKQWRTQDWVRIGTDGSILGSCGTSKNKNNPDRCLPRAKAESLQKVNAQQQPLLKRKKVQKANSLYLILKKLKLN